jgi:hypothetical protein
MSDISEFGRTSFEKLDASVVEFCFKSIDMSAVSTKVPWQGAADDHHGDGSAASDAVTTATSKHPAPESPHSPSGLFGFYGLSAIGRVPGYTRD